MNSERGRPTAPFSCYTAEATEPHATSTVSDLDLALVRRRLESRYGQDWLVHSSRVHPSNLSPGYSRSNQKYSLKTRSKLLKEYKLEIIGKNRFVYVDLYRMADVMNLWRCYFQAGLILVDVLSIFSLVPSPWTHPSPHYQIVPYFTLPAFKVVELNT